MIRERVPDSAVVPEIMRPLDLDALPEREKLIVPYIDGQRSIEEIALQTHNAEFAVSTLHLRRACDGSDGSRRRPCRGDGGRRGCGADRVETDVEHFLQRGQASAEGGPAGRLPDVQGGLGARSRRRPRRPRRCATPSARSSTALERDGVTGEKIPELAISIPELTERTFSPHEGFVLSRINGQWDVKSIMKISPMKELEVLMIFQRLWKDGVIRWKKK